MDADATQFFSFDSGIEKHSTLLERATRKFARRMRATAVFKNWRRFFTLFKQRDEGHSILETRSGLKLHARHNCWDARIIEEQFIESLYLKYYQAPSGRNPVVVDIGSYIGDFAMYCAHYLKARVVAYEPTAENYAILQKNIELNPDVAERLTAVPKGVASTESVVANVQVIGQEVHSSTMLYEEEDINEHRSFPCDTLEEILSKHNLDQIDLLKVDCEGGEYDIFPTTSKSVYDKINGIVFEWHKVPEWEAKLSTACKALTEAGFKLRREFNLIYATR